MKRILLFILIACLLVLPVRVYAEYVDWPIKTKVITENSANISELDAGTMIYGIKVIASANADAFEIYDVLTVAEAMAGTNPIDEISEAVAYNTAYSPLPHPYRVATGTTALIYGSATGIVYYRP